MILLGRKRRGLVLPSQFPAGLVGWIAPSMEADADAGSVAAVTNQANGSRLIAQSTGANQPTMRRRMNGISAQDAIQYATDDTLVSTPEVAAWTQNVGGFTMVAAVQLSATPALTSVIAAFSTSGAANARWQMAADPTVWRLSGRQADAGGAVNLSSSVVPDALPHVVHAMIDYSNTRARIWLDGALIASSNSFSTAGLTDNTASARARIGADLQGTTASFWNGKMGLMGFWNRAYYAPDLSALSSSWCQLYGINYVAP